MEKCRKVPLSLTLIALIASSCSIVKVESSNSNSISDDSTSASSYPSSTYSGEESVSWAIIKFGTTGDSSCTSPVSASCASVSGISVSSFDNSVKAYCESGKACRLGSSSSKGTLEVELSSSLLWSSFRFLAYPFSDSSAVDFTLTFKGNEYKASSRGTSSSVSSAISDVNDLSSWSDITGLSGNANSFSLTASSRAYLCALAIGYRASSSSTSSDLNNSASSVSSNSEIENDPYTPSEHNSSWTSWENGSYTNYIDYYQATSFRLETKESSDGSTATCYYYDENSGKFKIGETLRKEGIYTNSSEVSLYYNAFLCLPKNYGYYTSSSNANTVMANLYSTYGDDSRLYTSYSRTNGYYKVMPSLYTPNGFNYYELDLAYEPNNGYASPTKATRSKAGRIVIFPFGCKNYGSLQPFIVKTLDHYAHFREFANFLDGWGANFNGDSSDLGNGDDLGSYSGPLNTVSL